MASKQDGECLGWAVLFPHHPSTCVLLNMDFLVQLSRTQRSCLIRLSTEIEPGNIPLTVMAQETQQTAMHSCRKRNEVTALEVSWSPVFVLLSGKAVSLLQS